MNRACRATNAENPGCDRQHHEPSHGKTQPAHRFLVLAQILADQLIERAALERRGQTGDGFEKFRLAQRKVRAGFGEA